MTKQMAPLRRHLFCYLLLPDLILAPGDNSPLGSLHSFYKPGYDSIRHFFIVLEPKRLGDCGYCCVGNALRMALNQVS